jgi:hypothetical protein
MYTKSGWIVAAALAAVVAIAVVIGRFWDAIGATDISIIGWLAMGFGVVATLALGIGLMALMFYSSRHGYDDGGRGETGDAAAAPGDSDPAPGRDRGRMS